MILFDLYRNLKMLNVCSLDKYCLNLLFFLMNDQR